MYDELVKRLINCASDTVEDCAGCPYQGGYKGTYCMNGLISEAADAIEELKKRVELEYQSGFADGQRAANRKKNKWISVEEPPDTNRFVLVMNDDGRCGVAQYVGDDIAPITPWQIAYCLYDVDTWDDEEQGPACWWRELPEPPKEETAND